MGRIQATGCDAKGRKQYRYHARLREIRDGTKYEHVVALLDVLPGQIGERVREDMARRGLTWKKSWPRSSTLLKTTLIRVGDEDYAKQTSSYGLTTLKNRHVTIDGNEVQLSLHRQERETMAAARERQVCR